MRLKPFGMVTEDRLRQPKKVLSLMLSIPSETTIEVRLVQSLKVPLPIVFTLLGIEIEVRALHSQKAPSYIVVNPSEMVTDLRLVQ